MPRVRPLIVVIGSINMDLVCRTPRLSRAGETILGEDDLLTIPGGKGANQAVAAARLGADVHMIGRVGDDAFGRTLLAGLRENRVNTTRVKRTPRVSSGTATILVDRRGENSIVVSPGANARVSTADVDAATSVIRRASVVVLQLEIPLKTVAHAVALCKRLGVPTILDPAPVPPTGLPAALFRVDVLSPNEPEASSLVRAKVRNASALAALLVRRGAGSVALKLGKRGSLWLAQGAKPIRVPAFSVEIVDTTAAGDAFTAALAVAMAEGLDPAAALHFANAAGAVCCTRLGAQPSLPTRAEVERLMNHR